MRDIDVRSALRHSLRAEHEGDSSTRIVEEMGIWSGTVRIDVAVINGELSGYELKSDSDTLSRLPYQVEIYSKVFDRVTLVVGSRHIESAMSKIPRWWGVIRASTCGDITELECLRDSEPNPTPVPYLIADLLWRDEALAILDRYGLAKGIRSKSARVIHEKMAECLPLDTMKWEVRQALKNRNRLGQGVGHQRQVSI